MCYQNLKRYIVFSLICAIFWSCKKDDIEYSAGSEVQIELNALWNSEKIQLNQSMELDSLTKIQVNDLKFYISDLILVKSDSQEVQISYADYAESVFLYRLQEDTALNFQIETGEYIGMKFNVGLAPDLNDMDPNKYDATHPMSREQDMYWDMTKYRFLVLEAVADYPTENDFSHYISYHLGGEKYLRSVFVPFHLNVQSGQKKFQTLNIHLDKILNGLDYTTFFSFHSSESQEDLGLLMMDNFSQSFNE